MTSATQYSQDNQNYFNSHPHEEDDTSNQERIQKEDISTHILMKRMTDNVSKVLAAVVMHFNSHPHEEDDSNFKQNLFI